jgi:hypothetical protein
MEYSDHPYAPQELLSDPARAWLERYLTLRRSVVANYFHQAVRAGATTAEAVLAAVNARLTQALHSPYLGAERRVHLLEVCTLLRTERAEALIYAQAVLDYEALPPARRALEKAARQAVHRDAWMATQPATARQLHYLAQLGYRVTEPLNRRDASHLIDALRNQREEML